MTFPIDLTENTKLIAQELLDSSIDSPRVDCHTHVQGDLFNFTAEIAKANLIGSQSAGLNSYPDEVIEMAIKSGRLVRRTMIDAVPAYSWFVQLALGQGADFYNISNMDRRQMGKALMTALQPCRYSERAGWLKNMLSRYDGVKSQGDSFDVLDPDNFDIVYDAVIAQRNDPAFADKILKDDHIIYLVTSLENASHVPLKLNSGSEYKQLKAIDLSVSMHPEMYYMLDVHYIVCPDKATDLGPYFLGCKYDTENYIINIENRLGVTIEDAKDLRKAIKEWVHNVILSPSNPNSRVLYANTFQPIDKRLNTNISESDVTNIIKKHKAKLNELEVNIVSAYATQAILEGLNEIGSELKKQNGLGVCFQIAIGVDYFIDRDREIMAFKAYQPRIPRDEEPIWRKYPNIIFEYLVADEKLQEDFMDSAKQVPNVIVGPWWQGFGGRSIARMVESLVWESSINKFAGGISDARYVTMIGAKGESVRYGLSAGLALCVSEGRLPLNVAKKYMKDVLYNNPARVHNIPID
ncbi:TPA: hypothetical protein ENX78_04820 [Candidatus Poribacteria bacterium]|nr:hypothetical protein [Candidatus Poribacteria bacterium]